LDVGKSTAPLCRHKFISLAPSQSRLIRCAGIAAAALLIAGCTMTGTLNNDDQSKTIATLTAQADAWDRAIVRKDRAAIEANMADDFRQIDGRGNIEAKNSFVDDLVSLDLQIDPYTVEDFEVRLYGNVALLSGRTRMTGKYQGRPFASHYRYIDIYVRSGSQWKIVSVQVSNLPS
jgi:ketosteroid isomerase-like protein